MFENKEKRDRGRGEGWTEWLSFLLWQNYSKLLLIFYKNKEIIKTMSTYKFFILSERNRQKKIFNELKK